jgi:dihydroorotate dehydrogenase (NAD+) catalytic subunit
VSWIELAPHHKYGLPLPSPVMPAAGAFGYGEAYRDLIDYGDLGAIVTHPVSLRRRPVAHGPRVAARGEGFVVHTGLPNPGLKRVVREHRDFWARGPLPVIVHLLTTTPEEVARGVERLAGVRGVMGVELGLDDGTPLEEALAYLDAAHAAPLPVIARVPFGDVRSLALPLAEGGADALTLTAPPRAILPLAGREGGVRGRLYAPALLPLLLELLDRWCETLPVPVIACGGIASTEDALACLERGAVAVQVDALLWRDPSLLAHIAHDVGRATREGA